MKKVWKISLIALITLIIFLVASISANAEYQFNPDYYARKYPDVVNALGTDPEALSMHYRMYGIKEGRFANQQQEIDSMLPGYVNPSPTNVENPEPVVTAEESPTIAQINSSSSDKLSSLQIVPGMSTYIDVDIASQTVTYFEDGVVKLQAPCVTGNVSNGHSTPCGTYSVITKVPGKYLVGPTWKCWVNRWIQFTSSHIGLHDASWRSSFGGEIYKTDGSHGCVNMPYESVASLYDMVSVGTSVVVH